MSNKACPRCQHVIFLKLTDRDILLLSLAWSHRQLSPTYFFLETTPSSSLHFLSVKVKTGGFLLCLRIFQTRSAWKPSDNMPLNFVRDTGKFFFFIRDFCVLFWSDTSSEVHESMSSSNFINEFAENGSFSYFSVSTSAALASISSLLWICWLSRLGYFDANNLTRSSSLSHFGKFFADSFSPCYVHTEL